MASVEKNSIIQISNTDVQYFFVDKKYFVLADEAVGNAKGTINLNYHMCETPSDVSLVKEENAIYTNYRGNSNVKL